jgi:acyl-CoA hydrolase
VTEYGIADLQGKCLRERAKALIAMSHPDSVSLLSPGNRAKLDLRKNVNWEE